MTKEFKITGFDGHRQKISFQPSFTHDFSTGSYKRNVKMDVDCCDKTGTNDYVIVRITAETEDEIYNELRGQITDGLFENARIGGAFEDGKDIMNFLFA